ncbi:MAG: YceD family protein [Hydrogenobacter sp.]|uniref:YceD family protein n=1 Tax=Hydrogenobacter thermophilus TaxID=940 RepID=UPI0030F6ECB3
MVTLNLKEIFKRRARFTGFYRLSPKELSLPADMGELKDPVNVYVEITKEKGGYHVHMEIEGNITLECSRCLSPFVREMSLSEDVRIEPYPMRDIVHIKPKDLDVSFFEDEESFNLVNLVREQIILSVPTKPLCDPQCKGIPLKEESKGDTRFAILKKLIKG